MMLASQNWQSFHIFLADPVKGDRFLTEQLLPRLLDPEQGWTRRWFFIRYWEGGRHIRLRVQPIGEIALDNMLGFIRSTIAPYLSEDRPAPEDYYRAFLFERPITDISAMPWYDEGTIEPIAYEPEILRYGGPKALPYQEMLFEFSSQLVARILIGTQGNWGQRAALSMQMMIAAALSIADSAEALAAFFANYADYWSAYAAGSTSLVSSVSLGDFAHTCRHFRTPARPHLPKIWFDRVDWTNDTLRELGQKGELLSPLTGAPVRHCADVQEAIRNIVSSQIHMLNNRLGVAPDQEHFIAVALSQWAARSASETMEVRA